MRKVNVLICRGKNKVRRPVEELVCGWQIRVR